MRYFTRLIRQDDQESSRMRDVVTNYRLHQTYFFIGDLSLRTKE
jgi:hypothetical protein